MNYVDIIIVFVLLYAAFAGYKRGLIIGTLSLVVTGISIYFATVLYNPISQLLTTQFAFDERIMPLFVFLGLIILFEVAGGIMVNIVDTAVVTFFYRIKPVKYVDQVLGIIPSTILAVIFITLVMLLPVTVPMSPAFRQDVKDSWWGQNILPTAYTYVPKLEQLGNVLPTKSLQFLIPQSPSSKEKVDLQLPKQIRLTVDEASERQMLSLINQERISRGIKPLTLRRDVIPVARAHSTDMFERSYFSHENPDGESPFDRMEKGGVKYVVAGENLAYAPDVTVAHKGLMNSPGHKENILRPEFGQIGIGVIDGGIYGKMFTQKFTD